MSNKPLNKSSLRNMIRTKYSFSNMASQANTRVGHQRPTLPQAAWLQGVSYNMNPHLNLVGLQTPAHLKGTGQSEAYLRALVKENQRRTLAHPKTSAANTMRPTNFAVTRTARGYSIHTGRDSSMVANLSTLNSMLSRDNARDMRTMAFYATTDPNAYNNPYLQQGMAQLRQQGHQNLLPQLARNPQLRQGIVQTSVLWNEIALDWQVIANNLWDKVNEEVREALEKGAKIVVEAAMRESGGRFRAILGEYRPDSHSLRVGIGKDQWYARFFEEGADPHDIKPRRRSRKRKALRIRGLGRRFYSRVRHPGIRPNPFFRRSIERNEYKIVTAVGVELYFRVQMADFPPRGRPARNWGR